MWAFVAPFSGFSINILILQGLKEEYRAYLTIPNQLTALRILLVPVFVLLLLQGDPWLKLFGFIVFVVASLTDIYDGYHARKYGVETRLGAFLDPLADKLLITAAFFLYYWMGYLALWMVVLVVVRDVVVTALRVYAEYKNRPEVTSVESKYKTLAQNILVYLIMALILMKEAAFFGPRLAVTVNQFLLSDSLYYIMLVVTLFTVYTGVSYLVSNWSTYFQKSLEGR